MDERLINSLDYMTDRARSLEKAYNELYENFSKLYGAYQELKKKVEDTEEMSADESFDESEKSE